MFDFLSRFTVWRTYEHEVVANLPAENGRMELPVPFNLASLRLAFGPERSAQLQEKLISAYGAGTKVTILQLREATDPALSDLAQYVYDHIFVRYTMKQWGQTPEEIDPAFTARVPVFLSEDAAISRILIRVCPCTAIRPCSKTCSATTTSICV